MTNTPHHADQGCPELRRTSAPASRFDVAACAADAPATDRQRAQIGDSLLVALGPAADGLVHALGEARTVRDLLDVIATAQRAITMARGGEAAAAFASCYRGLGDD